MSGRKPPPARRFPPRAPSHAHVHSHSHRSNSQFPHAIQRKGSVPTLQLRQQHQQQNIGPPLRSAPLLHGNGPRRASMGGPMPTPRRPNLPLTRPHPHTPSSILYIDHVPSDLPEPEIAMALGECLPFRINLKTTVPPHMRIKPDDYYDWMPKSGTIEFQNVHQLEKAMATVSNHPLMIQRGVTISPYAPPLLLPLADTAARHIRPTRRLPSFEQVGLRIDPQSPSIPTPGEVFEALRPWGSLSSVQVWSEPLLQASADQDSLMPVWGARVEFWYEDEARRFETGFGEMGSLVKGWQISIAAERPSMVPSFGLNSPPMGFFAPPPIDTPISSSTEHMTYTLSAPPFLPPVDLQAAKGIMTLPPTEPFPPFTPLGLQLSVPPTPPQTNYIPPWSEHNPYTISHTDLPPPTSPHVPFPQFPTSSPMASSQRSISSSGAGGLPVTPGSRSHSRKFSSLSRASNASLRGITRYRKWSITTDTAPEGGVRVTGLMADDGTYIAHGPGQHIRPAPMWGPGSTSASGLVDYSNVFVKNLDPDINSQFLLELFENQSGRIVSARVMRDETGRSRGYGFVSFETPEEASQAISLMNGVRVGGQLLAVTLHEPRKLRPEKIAERTTIGQPTAYGREQSARSSFTPRKPSEPVKISDPTAKDHAGTTDDIRLLSPTSRHKSLVRRVTPRVKAYIQQHSLSQDLSAPTVKAIVSQDLELIPLLHDLEGLRIKIAETVEVIQSDPDVHLNDRLGSRKTQLLPRADTLTTPIQVSSKQSTLLARPTSVPKIAVAPVALDTAVPISPPAEPETNTSLTAGDLAKIRSGLADIDPADVEPIMTLLIPRLSPNEIKQCLDDRNYLALRRSGVKRELLKSRMKIDTKISNQPFPLEDLPPLSGLSQPSPTVSPSNGDEKPVPCSSTHPMERLPLDNITMDQLVGLPANQIVFNLSGEGGLQVCEKLSVARPSSKELDSMEDTVRKLNRKGALERRNEVVSHVARVLKGDLRRSQRANIAKDFVNAEDDDEAVCRLTLYPDLLEKRVAHRRQRGSGSEP